MLRFNKIQKNNQKTLFIIALLIFFVFCIYYAALIYLRIATDVQLHATIAWSFFNNNDNLSPNFLYFFLVSLAAGFSKYKIAYYVSSVILLSLAITSKFLIDNFYINRYINNIDKRKVILLSLSLLFIFCLPNINFFESGHFYKGQLAPNVWHNSTTIFLFPFAILLFFKSYEFLYAGTPKKNLQWQILFLILLNALIKPSFLFTLLPAVFSILFFRLINHDNNRIKLKKLIPFFAGFMLIAVEYFIIYRLNYSTGVMTAVDNSKIIFSPFTVWKSYSPNIIFSLISSCFFPLVYILISKGSVLKNKLVLFSALNFLYGLGVWALFAEAGFRMPDGNFYWQVVITNHLLFFTLLLHFKNDFYENKFIKTERLIIGGAFTLHVLWGILYWLKIIIFKGYG